MSLLDFVRKAAAEADPPISAQKAFTDATALKRAIDDGKFVMIEPYIHRLVDEVLGPKLVKQEVKTTASERRQQRLARRRAKHPAELTQFVDAHP